MPVYSVILIVISCIFHTTWNALSKKREASCKSALWANLLAILIFIPFIGFVKDDLSIYKHIWFLGLIAGFCNAVAYWGILAAYRVGDLTFVYPLNNAFPIILSAAFAVLIGKSADITGFAYIGFLLIIAGCLIIPIDNTKKITWKTFLSLSVLFILIDALGTAGYCNIDSNIMNTIQNTSKLSKFQTGILYIPYLGLTTSVFLIPFVIFDHKVFNVPLKETQWNFWSLLSMAIFIHIGYFLVFITYGMVKNVNYVIAFRQIGMLFTMIAGFFIFKEKAYPCKIIGGFLIVAGLVLTALF